MTMRSEYKLPLMMVYSMIFSSGIIATAAPEGRDGKLCATVIDASNLIVEVAAEKPLTDRRSEIRDLLNCLNEPGCMAKFVVPSRETTPYIGIGEFSPELHVQLFPYSLAGALRKIFDDSNQIVSVFGEPILEKLAIQMHATNSVGEDQLDDFQIGTQTLSTSRRAGPFGVVAIVPLNVPILHRTVSYFEYLRIEKLGYSKMFDSLERQEIPDDLLLAIAQGRGKIGAVLPEEQLIAECFYIFKSHRLNFIRSMIQRTLNPIYFSVFQPDHLAHL